MSDTIPAVDAPLPCDDSASSSGTASALTKLPDAQVFSRDPEDYTQESTADTIARLSKIVARQRKARQDDAEIAATTAKIKKANTAATKKKAKATNLLESTV